MKSRLLKTSSETKAMFKVQTVETIDEALKILPDLQHSSELYVQLSQTQSIVIAPHFGKYLVQIVCPNRYLIGVFPAPGWGVTWPREYLPTVLHGIAAMSNEMLQAAYRSGHSCVHVPGVHPKYVPGPSSSTTHPQKETYA